MSKEYLLKLSFINDTDPNKKYDKDIYLYHICLFHIYDGFLSSEYGSNIYLPYTLINYLETDITPIIPIGISYPEKTKEYINTNYKINIDLNSLASFTYIMKELKNKLSDENDYNIYLPLTSIGHMTGLYIYKKNDGVEIVHANTGFGLDTDNIYNISIDDKTYFDLYKKIYFKKEQYELIMSFLKPIIYFSTFKSYDKNEFQFCMNLFPLKTDETDYNTNIYNDIYNNNENFYKFMNNIFKEYKSNYITDKLNLNLNYKEFYEKWNNIIENLKDNYNEYRKISYKNINVNLKENKLLFELQKSGSCTYKSCLLIIIYHYIIQNKIDEFISKFDKLTSMLEIKFKELIENNSIYTDSPYNSITILNKAIDDNIYRDYNSVYERIINNNIVTVENSDNINVKKSTINVLPLKVLKNFIDRIRGGDKTVKDDIIKIFNKIDITIKQNYNEMVLLSILYEYYFNLNKWNNILIEFEDQLIYNNLSNYSKFTPANYNYSEMFTLLLYTSMSIRCELREGEHRIINRFQSIYNYTTIHKNISNDFEIFKEFSKKYTNSDNIDDIDDLIYNSNKFTKEYYNFNGININVINRFIRQNLGFKSKNKTNIIDYRNSKLANYSGFTNLIKYIVKYIEENVEIVIVDILKLINYSEVFIIFHHFINNKKEIALNLLKNFKNKDIKNIQKTTKYNDTEIELTIEYIKNIILNLCNIISDKYIFGNIEQYFISDYNNVKDVTFIDYIYNDDEFLENFCSINLNNLTDVNSFCESFLIGDPKTTNNFIKLIGNTIEYSIDDIKYIDNLKKITINNCIFINLLINNEIKYIYSTSKHIFIILKKSIYNYKDNLVFTIKYDKIDDKIYNKSDDKSENINIKLDFSNIYINGINFKYTNDYKIYPFMINFPKLALNFVNYNKNNYYTVYSLFNINNIKRTITYDAIIINSDISEKKYNFAEFRIKDNLLTPIYDNDNLHYINTIRNLTKYVPNYLHYKPDLNYNFKDDIKYVKYVNKIIRLRDEQFGSFDELSNIFEKMIGNILEKMNEEIIKDTDLVEWINSVKTSVSGTVENCTTTCDFTEIVKDIGKLNKKILLYVYAIRRKIIFNNVEINSFNTFLDKNYSIFSLILQFNILINNLSRLKSILTNCKVLSCHEIFEINSMFEKRELQNNQFELIFEIIFGKIIRQEQIDIYNDMIQNFNKKNRKIYQFMMGKGKSSLLTPILYYKLKTLKENKNRNINIVVPQHLKLQTLENYHDYELYFGFKPQIFSDSEIKEIFLENKINKNDIYLIDEIDFMYNPTISNFNILSKDPTHFDKEFIKKIFNLIINYDDKNTIKYEKHTVEEMVISIIKDKNNIKNITYGMSYIDNIRYCIPYLRQNSPHEKSQFTSPLLTLVLTILYSYNNKKFYLELDDIIYLLNTNNKVIRKFSELYNIDLQNITIDEFKILFDKKNLFNISIPYEMYLEYLYVISQYIHKATEIKNCSFIDIMNMEAYWMIGYSGTVNINMDVPKNNSDIKFDKNIYEDVDEKINVEKALKQYQDIYNFNNIDEIIDTFVKNKYDVLIDACAFFKDYTTLEITKILFEKTKRNIIFLTTNDEKKNIHFWGYHQLFIK